MRNKTRKRKQPYMDINLKDLSIEKKARAEIAYRHSVVNKKGIQAKFFTVDQKLGKNLKCIFTVFELSTSCRLQDIVVQS